MVNSGFFKLYDRVTPALQAGDYELKGEVEIDGDDADATHGVDDLKTNFCVSAPRYKMPPDQLLSVFPPAKSEGAYNNRLPQIVLKKRTLPWDRSAANAPVNGVPVTEATPWMALVVIAEGEGSILHDLPVNETVTDGVDLDGRADVARASCLQIGESTVGKIFPTIEELSLLTHVREVNIDDTEAMMGDDDGFLSVVIANRLPQFNKSECKNVRYTACLINLEGQLNALPRPGGRTKIFNKKTLTIAEITELILSMQAGAATHVRTSLRDDEHVPEERLSERMTDLIRRGDVVVHDGRVMARGFTDVNGKVDLGPAVSSDLLASDFAEIADNRNGLTFKKTYGVYDGFRLPLELYLAEKLFRFPLLASWEFTCTGEGSFRHFMQNLDVGMLGSLVDGGYRRPLACPDETETPPPGSPTTKLPLEVEETGHVGMQHLTRIGKNSRAWYRGPLSPHVLRRSFLAENDEPVLAHSSDQLRLVTPDGREDVSLAVAFETGRLLALSHLSVVASLKRWREQNYGKRFGSFSVQDGFRADFPAHQLPIDLTQFLDIERAIDEATKILSTELIGGIVGQPDFGVGVGTPLTQPGSPVEFLRSVEPKRILEQGLGFPTGSLDRLIGAKNIDEVGLALEALEPDGSTTPTTNLDDDDRTGIVSAREGFERDIANLAFGKRDIADLSLEEISKTGAFEDVLKNTNFKPGAK